MTIDRRSFVTGMSATAAAILAGCNKAEIDQAVITDLQAAFNGESNASAKYAFYGTKAQEAGYLSIAALFKAASFAEQIHARQHAKVLKLYGSDATATIKEATWVDIATALKDAIKGETYEFTEMYPGFIKTAEDKKMERAVRSFEHAMEAEKVHATFYAAALANTEAWKQAGKRFHICEVCGFTTDDDAVSICPYCNAPKSRFKTFSA